MDGLKSLNSLFKEKIFRIPDYQRGYAWQKNQYKDFWEDLINLPDRDERFHYTGVLTLQEIKKEKIKKDSKEHWLIEDHSYTLYDVVDGQQRLTTFVIFLQAFIDFIRELPKNKNKSDTEIYITESLNLEYVIERYLFKKKPTGNQFRTYKFGYTTDNPSYKYMRYEIFKEEGKPSPQETFYTLNLRNAKEYFTGQLKEIFDKDGEEVLYDIYKKLTKKFMFNEYIIKDEFDVSVAFETMNNRGKQLSKLELLKNRLIYLTSLYTKRELQDDERKHLRDNINDAWKQVYYQLGRNKKYPLNDDDFLRAHWIMYFQYSRKKGNDYIKFLLDEQFSPQKIYEKKASPVAIETPEEQLIDSDINETEDYDDAEEPITETKPTLDPIEIENYVNSLKESSVHWFNSYYPDSDTGLSEKEQNTIGRLNRIGMGYFRPLVMSVLKNERKVEERIDLLNQIERFIFIAFHLNQYRRNYRNSIFYNAAREFDKGTAKSQNIKQKLKDNLSQCFKDGIFNHSNFINYLDNKFSTGEKRGYYGWHGLRYFLYEYELSLLDKSRQKKISWEDLLKTEKDKISIEHIFPQTPKDNWKRMFANVKEENYYFYNGSLGNLLILSMQINISLQNDDFEDKKKPKRNDKGEKVRNGYSDGSHSEIEVATNNEKWTPEEIKKRGFQLLKFMEDRWDIEFESETVKEKLLFLPDSKK